MAQVTFISWIGSRTPTAKFRRTWLTGSSADVGQGPTPSTGLRRARPGADHGGYVLREQWKKRPGALGEGAGLDVLDVLDPRLTTRRRRGVPSVANEDFDAHEHRRRPHAFDPYVGGGRLRVVVARLRCDAA